MQAEMLFNIFKNRQRTKKENKNKNARTEKETII